MDFLAIIPARYASTRFPGKPLVDIDGRPMIVCVYERARAVFSNVYVATDDERIFAAVVEHGGKAMMTSDKHRSGTDRCAEAVTKIENAEAHRYNVVVNIQGDEPFVATEQLTKIKACFDNNATQIATMVHVIEQPADLFDENKIKVVVNARNEAMYFSRAAIPFLRGVLPNEWVKKHRYFKHIGMYAYRRDVLAELSSLPVSSLETAENLEQLRWLQNGYTIKVAYAASESLSVDTPADLERIKISLQK